VELRPAQFGQLLRLAPQSPAVGIQMLKPIDRLQNGWNVRRAFCERGIGKLLAEGDVEETRAIGYRTMKLDTLPAMQAALGLYEALGFVRCAAYYETPLSDTVFMELQL
jgi:putative acetyltransferase